MKKTYISKIITSSVIATSLIFANTSSAEMKIGVLNTALIMKDAKMVQDIKKRLETSFSKRATELKEFAGKIESTEKNLEKNAPTMTDSDKLKRRRELQSMIGEFEAKRREFDEDFAQREQEETVAFTNKINDVVKGFATAEKYDIILQEAVYANPETADVTKKILDLLNK
jgi:outer membrane protein